MRFLLPVVILILTASIYSVHAFPKGNIVATWFFDGDVKDYSGNDNNGIPNNVEYVEGLFGEALDLSESPDSFVEVPMSNTLDVITNSDFTLALWINPDVIGPVQMILQQKDEGGTGRTWLILNSNRMSSYFGGSDAFVNNAPIEADNWYHIALTVTKDGKLQWFINGDPQEEYEKVLEYSAGAYLIGIHKSGANVPYDGQIDDFGFFNTILSSNEIKELMEKGLRVASSVEPVGKLAAKWAQIKN